MVSHVIQTDICSLLYKIFNSRPHELIRGTPKLPAVRMHLKQDFWSILGQITNLAPGRCCFNVSNVITMLIPVATGNTRQAFADLTPLKDSTVRYQFCFLTRASNIEKLPTDQN